MLALLNLGEADCYAREYQRHFQSDLRGRALTVDLRVGSQREVLRVLVCIHVRI